MYDDEKLDRVAGGRRPGSVRDGRGAAVAAVPRDLRRHDRSGLRTRRAHGPGPVRPGAVAVSVRPAQGDRPEPPLRACPSRQRTLVRRAPAVPLGSAAPGRRLLAGLAVAVLAAVVVIGWGQLLGVRSEPAAPAAGPTVAVVTVRAEETVWDVARRVEPGADGPRLAAVAERIVVANSLPSVELQVGQVLQVPSG